MHTFENILVIKKTMDNILAEISDKSDLNTNEIRILLLLCKNSNMNFARDIVNEFKISKAHVSAALNTLEQKGYIAKEQDLQDKKKYVIKVEDKSTEIANEVHKKLSKILFNGINSEEINILNNTLEKICLNAKNNI